jgi:hypothetical protein
LKILLGACVISITLATATATPDHRSTAWIEGFSMFIAVAVVSSIQAVNDYQK